MRLLTRLVRVAGRVAYSIGGAPVARRRIARLRRAHNPLVRMLGDALGAAFSGTTAPDERTWIARIESLRRELSVSSAEIPVADHRAAAPRRVAEICRHASVPPKIALVLFKLIRAFRPSVCLEMGTCLGISAAYQGAALALNGNGRLVTLEGSDALVALARQNFARLGLDGVTVVAGRFQDALGDVARAHAPLDFAFVDGHHDEHATLAYFGQLVPFLAPTAVLVFDDISWSDGMRRAWRTITADARVGLSVDLAIVGLCVISRSLDERLAVRIPLFV